MEDDARGRGQLVVSRSAEQARPGATTTRAAAAGRTRARAVALPAAIRDAIVDARPGRVPERGVRDRRRRPAGGRRRRRAALGAAAEPAASPFRYAIDPEDLLRLTIETDDADEVFWAIVHSHVASPARARRRRTCASRTTPTRCTSSSRSTRRGGRGDRAPSLRAWRIVGGGVHEVEVSVTA